MHRSGCAKGCCTRVLATLSVPDPRKPPRTTFPLLVVDHRRRYCATYTPSLVSLLEQRKPLDRNHAEISETDAFVTGSPSLFLMIRHVHLPASDRKLLSTATARPAFAMTECEI